MIMTDASTRSANRTTPSPAPPAIWWNAGTTAAAKPGAARSNFPASAVPTASTRTYQQWQELGVVRADGKPFARLQDRVHLIVPVRGGPAFLIGQNFAAVKSYNPAFSYALAVCHLADRVRGDGPFVQQFPGGERVPTVEEVQEMQRRLTAAGFDTGGADGRVGRDTMQAVRAYQRKVGMEPADGYPGLKVLARLREGA